MKNRYLSVFSACQRLRKKCITIFGILAIAIMISLLTFLVPIIQAGSAYGDILQRNGYTVSRSYILREIPQESLFRDSIKVTNQLGRDIEVTGTASDSLQKVIELEMKGIIIKAGETSPFEFTVIGKEVGEFSGSIQLSGDIQELIPVNITVTNLSLSPELLLTIAPLNKRITFKDPLEVELEVNRILIKETENATFIYQLVLNGGNQTYELGSEEQNITGSFHYRKEFPLPKNIQEGYYKILITLQYPPQEQLKASAEILIAEPFLDKKLFGFLKYKILFIILGTGLIGLIAFIIIQKIQEAKKKYKVTLHTETLQKKTPETLYFGKIAESNIQSYYDVNYLTTHAVVAGATGGGKSIAAQVIVEEALAKNIAVIVFDPTAQWSGMLRKCEDKRMLSLYPKFGLKPTDARGYPGNIHLVKNARQAIDIKKYIAPGQIQVFALNKVDPSEMDTFVSSAIVSIFKSSPEEHPVLRTLLVFDEVHRLLPKFGGTGKGFLQIERACREFRKWGYGVLLVSQVLSDFVGEIKANINTEVQMRTRDESDLNRLMTKYGEMFLQSLIKASVGTGMFVNPKYNRGKPFFISFRPILHNTRRLSDEVLEKYNSYNEVIEDLEYQVEQLEQEKVDTFDLKMELKLVKDKLMSGNFTVVDIYLEGLRPRIDKEWSRLGKKPKKKELELIAETEINASLAAAQKDRTAWEKQQQKETSASAPEKKEDLRKKIVRPLNFDNGMSVSSIQELTDILPTLGDDIFKIHVNKNKNDIAKWVTASIDPSLGAQLSSMLSKNDLLQAIKTFKFESQAPSPGPAPTNAAQEPAPPSPQAPQAITSKVTLPETKVKSPKSKEKPAKKAKKK